MPEAMIGTPERACSRDADCGAQICHAYGNVPTGPEERLRSICADGAVVHGDPVTVTHVLVATLYGICWVVLLLLLSGSVFSRKELRG